MKRRSNKHPPFARWLCLHLATIHLLVLLEVFTDGNATQPTHSRRREWVSEVLRRRPLLGEYNNLIQEMRSGQLQRHVQYFRVTRQGFDFPLSRIAHRITRQHTSSVLSGDCLSGVGRHSGWLTLLLRRRRARPPARRRTKSSVAPVSPVLSVSAFIFSRCGSEMIKEG